MSTLVIDQRGTHLEHQSGALIVRMVDEKPQSISLNLVSRLVVAAAVQIDSTLLTHLAERGISILIMPGRGCRRNAFLYGAGHGDASRRIVQYQLIRNEASVLFWARRFVAFKVNGDMRLLQSAVEKRPDCRYMLMRGIRELHDALGNIRQAGNVASLRGLEGAASARFFLAYRSLFAASLNFENRNRRPPRDPVNAALSLGYTLAHSEAISAISRAGLDPMLGFLHDLAYNRESLGCDLVELARPRIEQLVWRLFAEQALQGKQFTTDGGACRMGKAARRAYFAAYERHALLHRQWFRQYAQILAKTCTDPNAASSIDIEQDPF